VQVVGQDHHGIDMKWMYGFHGSRHLAQDTDVVHQQALTVVNEVGEEMRPHPPRSLVDIASFVIPFPNMSPQPILVIAALDSR
jgi:hypothetical protein